MAVILPQVRYSVKQRLIRQLRKCREAGLRLRYMIVINLLNGRGAYDTGEVLGIHNTTGVPRCQAVSGTRRMGAYGWSRGQRLLQTGRGLLGYALQSGSFLATATRLASAHLDQGNARGNVGAANWSAYSCCNDESSAGDDPRSAWSATAYSSLSLVADGQKRSVADDTPNAGGSAAGPCRRLRR